MKALCDRGRKGVRVDRVDAPELSKTFAQKKDDRIKVVLNPSNLRSLVVAFLFNPHQ